MREPWPAERAGIASDRSEAEAGAIGCLAYFMSIPAFKMYLSYDTRIVTAMVRTGVLTSGPLSRWRGLTRSNHVGCWMAQEA